MGFKIEKNVPDLTKVHAWKESANVYFEHKGVRFFKSIISEDAPTDMEDAQSSVLTLSASGEAGGWSDCLGDYSLSPKEEHSGRAVYRKGDGWWVIYSQEDGTWAVSNYVGDTEPVMRSADEAISPALCQHWDFKEFFGSKYHPGEIMVTFE